MVGLIELIGVHGAAVSRIALVAVLFWGYYAIATTAGVPDLGRWFAWAGAAIHVVDALANVAAAATIGLAPVWALQLPTALAILAVTGVAVATRPPPIRDRDDRRRSSAGAPR